MRTFINKRCRLVLIASLSSMLTTQAQNFKTLHSFSGGSDGATPFAGLVLSGKTLYGTTGSGGTWSTGTVFAVGIDGSGYTNLYSFSGGDDGATPSGTLSLSGNTLYGEAKSGGNAQSGTLFALNTDGSGFRVLHTFSNADGIMPSGGLTSAGDKLYGTTGAGGALGWGNIFVLGTNGNGFTALYDFTGFGDGYGGFNPLALSGNTLYGVANPSGNETDEGSLFSVNVDGTNFKTLYSFPWGSSDGNPSGPLAVSSNVLYGLAEGGGYSPTGSVFTVTADGNGFKDLRKFELPYDGFPVNGLILAGNTLYGTTWTTWSGTVNSGTVFALNTDGGGYKVLYSFTVGNPNSAGVYTNADGMNPTSALLLAGSTLYGLTRNGGTGGYGAIFSIAVAPELTLTPAGPNVILSWPANFTGYKLQSSANLASPVWATNSAPPVIVNGQYTITNPVSATQQSFRLSQ